MNSKFIHGLITPGLAMTGLVMLCWCVTAPAAENGPEPFRCTVGTTVVLSQQPCVVGQQMPASDAVVTYQCRKDGVDVFQQQPCASGQQVIHLTQDTRDAKAVALGAQQAQSTVNAIAILQSDNAPTSNQGGVSKTGYTEQPFSGAKPSVEIGGGVRNNSNSSDSHAADDHSTSVTSDSHTADTHESQRHQ